MVPSEGLLPFQKWVEINDDGRNGTFKAVKLTNYNQKSNLIFIQPWEIISTLVSNYNLPTYERRCTICTFYKRKSVAE